ncbi:MAG: ABC transporter substrate-binding protein [Dehalococcoidia bacterium]|nr:ABC transporter substrate-binding protein [Dehalococcoidia bacterium]
MRLRVGLLLFTLLSAFIIVSCGGGEEATPAATATTKPAATTTSTQPTATASAQSVIPTPAVVGATGTIFDKAEIGKYELANVKYGGVWREQQVNTLGSLDPKLSTGTPISLYTLFAADKLVGREPNPDDILSKLAPGLAESWSISDDLKRYTFKIRKGVKWHNIAPVNGRELTVDDVVYTINRYKEKDSVYVSTYSNIESVTAPDSSTVVLNLKEPSAWAANDLFGNSEVIVPPELVAANNGTIPGVIIGTGPYILKDFKFRIGASYVRNPNYWQKDIKGNVLPYLDAVEIIIMSEPGTILAAMRTGQLDRASLRPGPILNLSKSTSDFRVFINAFAASDGLAFNTKKAPWNDVRVRRAFNMSIDKNKVSQVLNESKWVFNGPMPWSIVSDEPFTFDKLGPYYKYDPEAAKKLLIEAGYPDGKFKLAGAKLEYGQPSYTAISQVLQDSLKANGIEIELGPLDNSAYQQKWFFRTYDNLTLNHWIAPDYTLNWFAQIKFSTAGAQNISLIDDPAVNETIRNIKLTTDPAKLKQLGKSLWDFDTLGSYTVWVGASQAYTPTSSRSRNVLLRTGAGGVRIFPWLADAPRTSP